MEWWMEGWDEPFRFMFRFGRAMDDLMRRLEGLGLEVMPFGIGRTDVYIKDHILVVETEIPGARKEDIRVQIEEDKLIISGEVRRSEEVRQEDYIRMGRRYGAFRQVIPLPEEVEDLSKVKARFENGVLRVEIPLKRPPRRGGAFDVHVE
ncbi:Hsp20/alpha crystallin family protein [Candidatus Bipolaricaulota bacterium]|nr:Hsp20/alpha crystallin family protein [Candidatus Bipolaricaulota bacterium]